MLKGISAAVRIDAVGQPNEVPRSGRSMPPVQRAPGGQSLPVATLLVAGLLAYGWTQRDSGNVTSETGVGYWLGIVGGMMMLALLVYPLRKRLRSFAVLGSIPGWFQLHMLLGVLGPALVVLHSNFSLGSANSKAAMLAMLVVVGSGYIGRFLYSRIYQGFSGRKQSAREFLVELERLRVTLCHSSDSEGLKMQGGTPELLTKYQSMRMSESHNWLGSLGCIISGPVSRSRIRAKLLKEIRRELVATTPLQRARKEGAFRVALSRFLRAIRRAEAFAFYERSFAAWHLLHLPLFTILILSTIAHIVAVHLY